MEGERVKKTSFLSIQGGRKCVKCAERGGFSEKEETEILKR